MSPIQEELWRWKKVNPDARQCKTYDVATARVRGNGSDGDTLGVCQSHGVLFT